MNLKALAKELRAIAQRGGGFGSETERALFSLADAFEGREDLSDGDLKKLLAPKKPRASKSATFTDAPTGIIADYVQRLKDRADAQEGYAILSSLLKDKQVKATELKEIAGRFLGARLSFRTKADAAAAIKERIGRREWDQSVLNMINERA